MFHNCLTVLQDEKVWRSVSQQCEHNTTVRLKMVMMVNFFLMVNFMLRFLQ